MKVVIANRMDQQLPLVMRVGLDHVSVRQNPELGKPPIYDKRHSATSTWMLAPKGRKGSTKIAEDVQLPPHYEDLVRKGFITVTRAPS